MVKKTTCKELRKFANEEMEAAEDYFRRGFIKQAIQEREHSKFFKKLFRRCK